VFGIDHGQVNCAFHNDSKASAGVSYEGQYNCFACSAKAHNEIGFIAKYFGVSQNYAARIKSSLEKVGKYKYNKDPLTDEQVNYLRSIGLTDQIITKHFFKASTGKLIYDHKWNGITVATTWFNNPVLSNYNASDDKYKYGAGSIAGMVTPYDTVQNNKTIVVCEGEKDMLTALSKGVTNAVAKIGGAKSYLIGGVNWENKNVVIIYDCDQPGRDGAKQDAINLIRHYKCNVKIVDLGLNDKEDLNDYFIKYNKTVDDLYTLFKNTPLYVPSEEDTTMNKLERFVSKLTTNEIEQLRTMLNAGKGE
jgi:hypothetical protein